MDDLIKKLKKMVNEEKNKKDDYNSNDDLDEYDNKNKYENENENEEDEKNNINILNSNNINNINNKNQINYDNDNNNIKSNNLNTIISNDNLNNNINNSNNINNINNINNVSQKNFYETQIDKPFTVSEMKLSRSRSSSKNKKHRFSKSLSEENNNLNKPSNNLSLISKTMYLEKENQDSITNLLTKTLAHIKSNKNNYDIDLITNNLNQILDLYINSLSNQRLNKVKSSEKDIILQTKYETAERMVKNFELKYLTVVKQYNELEAKYKKIMEKNEINVQKNEEFLRLEKNNYVLMQTNEDLKKQLNEMNIQNDFVKKKYDDEIKVIQKLLNQYHQQLIQLQNKIFVNNNDKNQIKKDNNNINDDRINNFDNNNCYSPNNDKSLTLNSL